MFYDMILLEYICIINSHNTFMNRGILTNVGRTYMIHTFKLDHVGLGSYGENLGNTMTTDPSLSVRLCH